MSDEMHENERIARLEVRAENLAEKVGSLEKRNWAMVAGIAFYGISQFIDSLKGGFK